MEERKGKKDFCRGGGDGTCWKEVYFAECIRPVNKRQEEEQKGG